MADLKISQLPAATTPLAGTEVLPIVQSGTTVQVSVNNVIASRASLGANTFTGAQTLPAAGAILTGSTSGTTTLVAAATASGTARLPAAGGTLAVITTNTFTGAQIGAVTALTSSGASIAINLATNNNFSYTTSESSTLAAPSNPVAGQSGVITITQGGTARTLAYNTFWKFPGGTVPTLTATAGAVDVFAYSVESGSRCTCQLIKDVK
jgi:hypothetical protein